jgi:hypothetical protein
MEKFKAVSTPMVLEMKLTKEDGATCADGRTYRMQISRLLYLSFTQPEIVWSAILNTKFMQNTSQLHYITALVKADQPGW